MLEQVDRFVEAAREIQRAGSVDEVSRALAVAMPGCEPATSGAVVACLRALEVSQAQRSAASIELASDSRLEARRMLTRLLCAHADRELSAGLADLAVQAVAALSASPGIARAAADADEQADAFAGLGGATFISSHARTFASAHGLDDEALGRLLTDALGPIRRACNVEDACSLGELRFTARHGSVEATATLQRSGVGSPLIRVRLHLAGEGHVPQPQDHEPPGYAARVLRRLVK